jgi:hypothetical protein
MVKIWQQLQQSVQKDVLFIRVAGGIFVALGILFMSSGRITTLTCNRVKSNQGNCQLISSGLLGSRVKKTQLSELHGAKIIDNPMDDDASRVVLVTQNGEFPLTSSTSGNDTEATATASDINTFIQQVEKTSLTIQHDERGLYFPVGASIIAFGLFTLMFPKTVRPNC